MSTPTSGRATATWGSAAIVEVLRDHFGLQGVAVSALGGELDQNAAVELSDGSRVVVKVSPPGEDVRHIRWQHELLRLAGADGALGVVRVPVVLPSIDGDTVIEVDRDGVTRAVWVQSWLDGVAMSELNSHSVGLLTELGATAASFVRAFASAPLPPGSTGHHWDLLRAPDAVAQGIAYIDDTARLEDVQHILSWFNVAVGTHRASLPQSVVHHDLNDFNVLAQRTADGRYGVGAVVDFADALHTARISELAIAIAYAMLRKANPLSAAAAAVRGYSAEIDITDAELAVLYPMAAARLCVNGVTWTQRSAEDGQPYGRERMKHTWPTIARLAATPPELAEAMFRQAAGRDIATAVVSVAGASCAVPGLDFTPVEIANAVDTGREGVERPSPGTARLGPHLEPDASIGARRSTESGEAATLRLGVEIEASEPFTVLTPLDAEVESRGRATAVDGVSAGPVVVLRHERGGAETIWSRWTGLSSPLPEGASVQSGEAIGSVPGGASSTLQVSIYRSRETALLATSIVVPPSETAAWACVSPDPSDFLGLDGGALPDRDAAWDAQRVLATREVHFARSQRSYYKRPMNLVSGRGSWLFDELGRGYLDAINNVTHVGHSNPRVVAAANAQMLRLNTNSRFLYPGIAQYAERLTSLLPDQLSVAFFVCSGSEANDLAVRMARQVTGRSDVLVVDGAYHGNTSVVTGLSPNRYKGPGGTGPDETTHEVEQPNLYRGRYTYDDLDAGSKYAADVARQVDRLTELGKPPAAFIAESAMGTAGSIFYPDGYLEQAFATVRHAGALCIADEVQVGFGRLGEVFWGFESHGVVPDIVTMGKPIGNGHPMAAVVTTRDIADAFDSGMRYFNTFGGNPVSCAIGTAVLDEIAEQGLQAHAAKTGLHFKHVLGALASKHELIGDVRGRGMYLGIELVRDRATKEPASEEALLVSELMKDEGVIVYPTGSATNVLKIKPPLTFTSADADLFTAVLDEVLTRDW
jgi:4-aminobutyrate aminotransferase-like enzyme/Ser/Thr protein kinase RdoA (MazF antagonist)